MKVEVAVLGSPSLIILMVSVDVKQHLKKNHLNLEFKSCVKVEVAVLDSPSLTVRTVSVDVKQHSTVFMVQELCESRGGRPGKTSEDESPEFRAQELFKS